MSEINISPANKSYLSKQDTSKQVEQEKPKTSNTKHDGEKYIVAGLAALATAGIVAFSIAKKMRGKSVAPTLKEPEQVQKAAQEIPQKIRKFINDADVEIDNVKLTNGLYKTDNGKLFTGTYSRTLKDGRIATMKIADGKTVSVSFNDVVKEYKTLTLPETSLGEFTQTGFVKSRDSNPFYEKYSIKTDDGRIYRRAVYDKSAEDSKALFKFEEYDLEVQKQNPNSRLIKAKGRYDSTGEVISVDIYNPKTGKPIQTIEKVGIGTVDISTPLEDGTIKHEFKNTPDYKFNYYTPIEDVTSQKSHCVLYKDKNGNILRSIEKNTTGWKIENGGQLTEITHINGSNNYSLRFDDLNKSSDELPPRITINTDGSNSTLHDKKITTKDKDLLGKQYEELTRILKDEGMEEIPSDVQEKFKKALFATPSNNN